MYNSISNPHKGPHAPNPVGRLVQQRGHFFAYHRHGGKLMISMIVGAASVLAVNGKRISVVKQKNNKYRTRYLPYAEFNDLETLARSVIDVHRTLRS